MHLNALDDLANLIFLGAYLVKDILWLRLLTIVGSLVVIPFYLLQTDTLWTPIMWSGVFIGVNAVRAWGIVKERRPVTFTGDEQFLYDNTFNTLSPQQFKRLLAIGEWQDLERGSVLHSTGDPPDSLEAVVRGELEARRHGRVLGHARRRSRGPGQRAGWLARALRRKVTQPARIIRWRRADLQRFAGADESLTSALRKIAGAALAGTLIRAVQDEC
jgi:hypothetical protein